MFQHCHHSLWVSFKNLSTNVRQQSQGLLEQRRCIIASIHQYSSWKTVPTQQQPKTKHTFTFSKDNRKCTASLMSLSRHGPCSMPSRQGSGLQRDISGVLPWQSVDITSAPLSHKVCAIRKSCDLSNVVCRGVFDSVSLILTSAPWPSSNHTTFISSSIKSAVSFILFPLRDSTSCVDNASRVSMVSLLVTRL